MNSVCFNILNWYAFSPDLFGEEAWKRWTSYEGSLDSNEKPSLKLIPPMMRRRMSTLSKLALQAAISASKGQTIDYLVFASRHGELNRTAKLLQGIMSGEDASPTAFSQSVHNTAAGLFTIATKQAIPVASLAAGEHTLHNALIEAAGYLHENPSHRVLLVDFDEPLPPPYEQYEDVRHQSYAVGMVLTAGENVRLSWQPMPSESGLTLEGTYPQTLTVLSHLSAEGKVQWTVAGKSMYWYWQR
ncbi:beta-ketoacyl synthase chain length factor [Photobacterium makurazakiensis]|uniref:beta-ketoacyl synthase chain length factor n=1 Tax=Photobacterium makurazakiensis TaxID=2910234 RepID=UPI003D10CD64